MKISFLKLTTGIFLLCLSISLVLGGAYFIHLKKNQIDKEEEKKEVLCLKEKLCIFISYKTIGEKFLYRVSVRLGRYYVFGKKLDEFDLKIKNIEMVKSDEFDKFYKEDFSKNKINQLSENSVFIALRILDSDAFKLEGIEIPFTNFTKAIINNDNNRFQGVEIDGELELTKDVSKNIHSVDITWFNGLVKVIESWN